MGLAHVLLPELLELLLERLAGDLLVAAVGRVPHVHQGALGGGRFNGKILVSGVSFKSA